MSFNQVENAFLADAIRRLEGQYRKLIERGLNLGYYLPFRLGGNPWFMVVDDGKLTVAETRSGTEARPHPHFEPVPCYDRIRPGEDLATAVTREFCNDGIHYDP